MHGKRYSLSSKTTCIAMIAVGLFPLMHAALLSRLANSNMCMIYETSTTKILQIKFGL